MTEEILSAVDGQLFAVWFLIGAALVFWMQAGFAMVETGFTRAKNAGNILMKNLMDFCIGTVVFILIGFGLLFGEDVVGLIGKPGLDIFTSYENFDYSNFVFNLVFCATTATIVSGAMAERTKFLSYCIYSGVISALIYPIEAHWIWGGGWLAQLGFHDFAGGTVVHTVGGMAALRGAKIVGPRIDKYDKNGRGRAIPGHNIILGALGIMILWFGWFGFNGGSVITSGVTGKVGNVYLNTILSAGIAAVAAMITSKIRYKKADISMTINGILAGLVAITCGCDQYTPLTACLIGIFAGVFSIIAIQFVDKVLKIDDPVGAIGVHGFCGILGTLLAGLFSKTKGLFYTGNADFFLTQLLGSAVVVVFVLVIMGLAFTLIKHTSGLRVSAAEEIEGLDNREHGLNSAYGDFVTNSYTEILQSGPSETSEHEKLVPITLDSGTPAKQASSISKVEVIMKRSRFEAFKEAMNRIGVTGMTVSQVVGCGMQKGQTDFYRGTQVDINLIPKIKVEIVIAKVPVETASNFLPSWRAFFLASSLASSAAFSFFEAMANFFALISSSVMRTFLLNPTLYLWLKNTCMLLFLFQFCCNTVGISFSA